MAQRGPRQARAQGGDCPFWGAAQIQGESYTHSVLGAASGQSPSPGSLSTKMPQICHVRTWHLFFDHLQPPVAWLQRRCNTCEKQLPPPFITDCPNSRKQQLCGFSNSQTSWLQLYFSEQACSRVQMPLYPICSCVYLDTAGSQRITSNFVRDILHCVLFLSFYFRAPYTTVWGILKAFLCTCFFSCPGSGLLLTVNIVDIQ